MAYYKTCPNCGATLDPEEICDCVINQRLHEKHMEEKQSFISDLRFLLLGADVDLVDLKLLDEDTVEAIYIGGAKRKINIALDNKISIVKDVAKNII